MFVDKKAVGERICSIRKEFGYSMQRFGELIDNAPKGSVNSWEKGVNLPNDKRLKQIATLGNITYNELIYGSFKDYTCRLIKEKLEIQLQEDFLAVIQQLLQKNGYTYGDDIEIVRLVNGFLNYHNLVSKETVIFYQPTGYSGTYYEGIIQRADYSVLICNAHSEKDSNTLHIVPIFGEEKNEERIDFFHSLEKLNLPHKHDYFTSGFLTLGLSLRDSKIIYYGIDEKKRTANVLPYEYICEKDCYTLNEDMVYTLNQQFVREAEKEAVYQRYQSQQKKRK